MYMALLIFYTQVIRGDRLDRLDAFYLCQDESHFKEPPELKSQGDTVKSVQKVLSKCAMP